MDLNIIRITELGYAGPLTSNDVFAVVDVNDTTMAPQGTNKKARLSTIAESIMPLNGAVGQFLSITSINPSDPRKRTFGWKDIRAVPDWHPSEFGRVLTVSGDIGEPGMLKWTNKPRAYPDGWPSGVSGSQLDGAYNFFAEPPQYWNGVTWKDQPLQWQAGLMVPRYGVDGDILTYKERYRGGRTIHSAEWVSVSGVMDKIRIPDWIKDGNISGLPTSDYSGYKTKFLAVTPYKHVFHPDPTPDYKWEPGRLEWIDGVNVPVPSGTMQEGYLRTWRIYAKDRWINRYGWVSTSGTKWPQSGFCDFDANVVPAYRPHKYITSLNYWASGGFGWTKCLLPPLPTASPDWPTNPGGFSEVGGLFANRKVTLGGKDQIQGKWLSPDYYNYKTSGQPQVLVQKPHPAPYGELEWMNLRQLLLSIGIPVP